MSKKNKATALPSQTAHGKSEKSTNVIDPDLEIYKILFENLHDEVHLWKLIKGKNRKILNWQLVDANPAALNGWKKQKEEVVGRNPDEIFGEGTSAQFLPIVERIFKTGQPEHWVEYFEPTNQFLKMTSIPMGNFFISTGKDITQEKLTENALKESRGLLQQTESISNQGSWKYDIQEDRWSFSENWLRIFGFEKAPSSAQLSEIVDPRDSEIVIEMFSKAIKGEASYALEHRINPVGKVRWVKVSAILHKTPEGNPHYLIGATRDITEEKQAQDSLKENTELLNTAEKMANQGSWKWDIKNDEWTFSENWFQLHIGSRKPVLGKEDLMKLAYPDDIPKINKAFAQALSGESPYNLEHRFIKQDTGEVRWARASGKVIFSSDGEPEYMIGIGQDISDEKRAERDLLESEKFLNRTGEIAKVGGWRLDVQSGRAHFTQVTHDIHELPYDHQISLDEAINFYPPEERDRVRAHVDKAIHQGIPYSFEARFITAKGIEKWVLSKAEPEMVDGKCVRLSGIFQDITERKNTERELERSEQKFKSVFQNAAVAHVLANAEGRYIDANEKACELFGYERDELLKLNVTDIVKSRDKSPEEIYRDFQDQGYDAGEVEITTKSGEIKTIEYYARKIDNDSYLSTQIDITEEKTADQERIKAEEKLRESEERLRDITNSVPGTIYQFKFNKDGSFSIPFMSDRANELLGFEKENMEDVGFIFSRIHPEDFDETMNSIAAANQDGYFWSAEFRALNRKNEMVWIQGQSYGKKDKEGNIVHSGVFFDITNKKESEKALKDSERTKKNIAENIPGVVLQYRLNPDGTDELTYISQGVEELYEISVSEAISQNKLLWDRVHKDDLETYLASVKASAANLSPWELEHRLRFPDGRIKWIYMRGTPSKQADGSVIWDSIGIDITKQKEAELKLARLNTSLEKRVEERTSEILEVSKKLELYYLAAEHAETGVFKWDVVNNELSWDDNMLKLYGVEKSEFRGAFETWENCLHPDDVKQASLEMKEVLHGKKPFDTIYRVVQPNTGKTVHIRAKGKVERDESGEAIYVLGSNWDITKEMELVEARQTALNNLKETQSQLVQAEKMASLGVLTAGVAHEINNPLNYILGGYEVISSYLDDHGKIEKEQLTEYLGWIKTGADRASEIVKSLNLFSRSNDEKEEDCEIQTILENCILVLGHKHKDRVKIIKDFAQKEPIIKGNMGRLHQAFLNILSNAIDAIPHEGEIRIKTKQASNKIQISISDNGIGIEEEVMDRIMDPFFTTKAPGVGTGLGLSITQTIISEHGGHLFFDSVLNKGTTFTVELPKS